MKTEFAKAILALLKDMDSSVLKDRQKFYSLIDSLPESFGKQKQFLYDYADGAWTGICRRAGRRDPETLNAIAQEAALYLEEAKGADPRKAEDISRSMVLAIAARSRHITIEDALFDMSQMGRATILDEQCFSGRGFDNGMYIEEEPACDYPEMYDEGYSESSWIGWLTRSPLLVAGVVLTVLLAGLGTCFAMDVIGSNGGETADEPSKAERMVGASTPSSHSHDKQGYSKEEAPAQPAAPRASQPRRPIQADPNQNPNKPSPSQPSGKEQEKSAVKGNTGSITDPGPNPDPNPDPNPNPNPNPGGEDSDVGNGGNGNNKEKDYRVGKRPGDEDDPIDDDPIDDDPVDDDPIDDDPVDDDPIDDDPIEDDTDDTDDVDEDDESIIGMEDSDDELGYVSDDELLDEGEDEMTDELYEDEAWLGSSLVGALEKIKAFFSSLLK